MIKTIVFGFDSFNTAGSIRCLGEAGYTPFLIVISTKRRTAVQKSKYILSSVKVSDINEGIKVLFDNIHETERQYLFATSDKVAIALDGLYDKLCAYYLFPNSGCNGLLAKLMDKHNMSQIATRNGLCIPETFDLQYNKDVEFKYPLIIKPKDSVTGSKQDIRIVSTKQEWDDHLKHTTNLDHFIAQRYIDKENECLIIGCRCESGNIYLPGHFTKNRWVANGDAGAYGILKRNIPNGIDITAIKKFLTDLNYVGPFSLEFGLNKIDKKFYFFEINLRNDGTIHYFTKIGINIPETWIKNQLIVNYSKQEEAIYIDEFGDLLNVIRGDLKLAKWANDFHKASVFKYYDKLDKGPFFIFAPKMIRVILANIYHKIK